MAKKAEGIIQLLLENRCLPPIEWKTKMGITIEDVVNNKAVYSYIESLLYEGILSSDMSKIEDSEKLFIIFHKIDRKNKETNFYLAYIAIIKNDSDKLIYYLDNIFTIEGRTRRGIYNLYLFLMTFITELPSPYDKKAYNTAVENSLVLKRRSVPQNDSLINQVLKHGYRQELSEAMNKLKEYDKDETLLKILLSEAIKSQEKLTEDLKKLIQARKIDEALSLLQEIEKRHPLNDYFQLQKRLIEAAVKEEDRKMEDESFTKPIPELDNSKQQNDNSDILPRNSIFTERELKEFGIDDSLIDNLIECKALQKTPEGNYLTNFRRMHRSATKNFYIGLNDIDKIKIAKKLFKICLKIATERKSIEKIMLYLFYIAILKEDYIDIEKYHSILASEDSNAKQSYIFNLYLASFLSKLPSPYLEITKGLESIDFLVKDNTRDAKEITLLNIMRQQAYRQDFMDSYKTLCKYRKDKEAFSKIILQRVVTKERKFNRRLFNLVMERDFENALSCLQAEEENHNLSISYETAKILIEDILQMINTDTPFISTPYAHRDLKGLIVHHNYSLAYKTHKNDCIQRGIDCNRSIIFQLLKYAMLYNELLIKKSKSGHASTKVKNVPQTEKSNRKNYIVDNVFAKLLEDKIDEAIDLLKEYLENIGMSEYEYLIENLILISVEAEETSFTTPMIVLSNLKNRDFKINITRYIEAFASSIDNNYLKEARYYLTIILQAYKKGHIDIETRELTDILEPLQNKLREKEALMYTRGDYSITPNDNKKQKKGDKNE